MRIALWNASCLDNLGDQLLDTVNRRELGRRLPMATFETFSLWPSETHRQVVIDAGGHWCGESSFTGIVIGGGALLIGPPFVHPSLQTCYLGPHPANFRDQCPIIWNAVCSDAQVVCTLSDKWRNYVQTAASRLTYRTVRNWHTAQMLKECGVTEQVDVVPDPVVLFERPRASVARRYGRRRIGVAISDSPNAPAMVAHLTSPCSAACNHDVTIHVAPEMLIDSNATERGNQFRKAVSETFTCLSSNADIEVCGFGAVYGDTHCAQELAALLRGRNVSIRNGGEALSWIRSLDCLIASRLHAVILSVVAGTPVVAIDPYYSHIAGTSKLMGFMADAELLDVYATREQFVSREVNIAEVVETAIARCDRIPTAHQRFVQLAESHFDNVAGLLAMYEGSTNGSFD